MHVARIQVVPGALRAMSERAEEEIARAEVVLRARYGDLHVDGGDEPARQAAALASTSTRRRIRSRS